MLIFQFVHTNRIAISVSKCELQQRSFTAQWDFLFLFFSFLRKSGKLQSNHTGPVLCLDMGKRISILIPPNLSFRLNYFIVASDGGRGETTTMPSTFFLSRLSHLSSSSRSKKLPWL